MVGNENAGRVQDIHINTKWCKGCRICIEFCPKKVYDANKRGKPVVVRIQECIDCRLCELRCPDLAISIERGEGNGKRETNNV